MKRGIGFVLILTLLAGMMIVPGAVTVSAAESDPFAYPSERQTMRYATSFEEFSDGSGMVSFNRYIVSYSGSEAPYPAEHMGNLFDGNVNTKYLTENSGSATIQVKLDRAVTVTAFSMTSANDAPERDPYALVLKGSQDGQSWTNLATVNRAAFTARFQIQSFAVSGRGAYQWFQLVISRPAQTASPYVQLSEFGLYGSTPDLINGCTASATVGSVSFTGNRALTVSGAHSAASTGHSYTYATIASNVNLPVNANTRFSYVIRPDYTGAYDNRYLSHYVGLDICFTDGTYLRDLEAFDQNGDRVHPRLQGEARAMVTRHWNYICCDLGTYAAGKTIAHILVGFDHVGNNTGSDLAYLAQIDDVKIYDEQPEVITSKTQYASTLYGTYGISSTDGMSENMSRGLCFPGTRVPNGFTAWTAATTAGKRFIYDYTDSKIVHFATSHQASAHVFDYGILQFMPNTSVALTGSTRYAQMNAAARACAFSHDHEIARPNLYSVTFDNGSPASGVRVDIAPTDHCAVVRFTFPQDSVNRNLIFDCTVDYTTPNGTIAFNGTTLWGQVDCQHPTLSNGASTMYFYGTFSATPVRTTALSSAPSTAVAFDSSVEQLQMNLATSFISVEQAQKNLSLEVFTGDTVETVAQRGAELWDAIFDVVEVEGATRHQLQNLYTDLYRMYSYPSNYSENTGTAAEPRLQYMSPYSKTVQDGQLYVNNGFWDTYRTTWPAYSLLTPEKAGQLIDGLLQHYRDFGYIPRWTAPGDVVSMVGTSSDIVLADAAVKGVVFDYEEALDAIVKDANTTTTAAGAYARTGNWNDLYYGVPLNSLGEPVSWQFENNICDFGGAALAELLGQTDLALYLRNRSLGYVHLYEPESGFFVRQNADRTFAASGSAVDPYEWYSLGHIETCAWGMAFAPTQDTEGLAYLYGGKNALAAKLDTFLSQPATAHSSRTGTTHEMIEGRECKMGQYFHSNQPAHGALYLYNTAGQPYKTQRYTREVLDRLYVGGEIGQGYLGDEDNGEQAAWYVLSALGFYPLVLGSAQYAITAPLFDRVTLHLPTGNVVIEAENNSTDNVYIQSMTVDGTPYDKTEISHADLIGASEIRFVMGNNPSDFGTDGYHGVTSVTTGTASKPMVDLTPANIPTALASAPSGDDTQLWATAAGGGSLFDNLNDINSVGAAPRADASGTEGASMIAGVGFATPQTVKMVTLTNAWLDYSPRRVAVYASQTGADDDWTLLREAELTYTFGNQLVPVAVPNTTPYRHYKMVVESPTDFLLSEVEWLGFPEDTPFDLSDLDRLLTAAEDLSAGASDPKGTFSEAKQAAFRTLHNPYADDGSISRVYTALYDAAKAAVGETALLQALGDASVAYVYGDVNGDGAINCVDALYALQAAVGKYEPDTREILAGDVNGNGEIDVADALLILRWDVGLIAAFPVESEA